MVRICVTVFLLLVSMFCAANCTLDKEKLDKMWEDIHKEVNSDEPKSIRILVMGKVGVGKSTLVNTLAGGDVANAGHRVTYMTKKINSTVSVKNGIHVYITDTPGLDNVDTDDKNILEAALGHNKDIDLFLFCMKMTKRFDHHLFEQIKAITNIFGNDIWNKGLFVLTFANTLSEKEEFVVILKEWKKEVRERMKQIIDPEVAEKIPIVPTGYREPQLSDQSSWLSEFWIQGFKRMGFKAMLHLILFNRIHGAKERMELSQDQHASSFQSFKRYVLATISNVAPWMVGAYENIEEVDAHYYDEVMLYSLISAFLGEHPEA